MTQVLPERFQESNAVHAINLLLDEGDVSQLSNCGLAGLFR